MIGVRGWIWIPLWVTAYAAPPGTLDSTARFEVNQGQASERYAYVSRGSGYLLGVESDGITLRSGTSELRLQLIGSQPAAAVIPLDRLSTDISYFIGADPKLWRHNVPSYARVLISEVYPGIDLTFSAEGGQLSYEFTLQPGANPGKIRYRLVTSPNSQGNTHVSISAGDLLSEKFTEARRTAPRVYQIEGRNRTTIDGSYVWSGSDEVELSLGAYDRLKPLAVASAISYSTLLGGTGGNTALAVAVDSIGNSYVAGWTESLDILGNAGTKMVLGQGVDSFIAKLNASGTAVTYITYLGGRGDDRALAVAVDSTGSATIAGSTYSTDLPLMSASQLAFGGVRDCFIAKLNPAGTGLVFSTYLGGSNSDACNGVAVDSGGNIYVAGETTSTQFPLKAPVQSSKGGGQDAFVARYTGAGVLQYSTYLGGAGDDRATAIAVDAGGNAYITGATASANFPVLSAWRSTLAGSQDAFVSKLTPAGTLLYSTFVGGSSGISPENGNAIAVDSSGNAYVAGVTSSQDFPMVNPFQASLGGSQDAFVFKLSPAGNALIYSTYLGGLSLDAATAIAVDGFGQAYVAGYTSSLDFPLRNAIQSTNAGGYDGFLTVLGPLGNVVQLSTFYGGTGFDSIYGVALDSTNNIYIAGQTLSSNYPLIGGVQSTKSATMNAMVTKFSGTSRSISGRVISSVTGSGLAGVSITLSGSSGASTTTDISGAYSFGGLAGGNYLLQPSATGYSFTPASQSFSGLPTDQLANFSASTGTNLAMGKYATQSSTLPVGSAAAVNGVDGNTDGNFWDNSVTHTSADSTAWWQVDLGSTATITSIVLWGRTDCCASRLTDYWVFVSNSAFSPADTPTILKARAGVWSIHQTVAPNPSNSITVGGASGRYVRVQLSGTDNLSLAEVQVIGASNPNLALGKSAMQSSTIGVVSALASAAIDGNTDGNFWDGSVTHTNADLNAWWQVDLGSSALLTSVQIWGRTECCSDRLSDYWIFVSDAPFGLTDTPSTLQTRAGTWSSHQTSAPSPSTTIWMSGIQGRYIRVQLSGTNNLSLAEVVVAGSWRINLALGKPTTQSSTLGVATAISGSAVDGNSDGVFWDGSVTHTNADLNAWWQVDLGASKTVSSIQVWNRTDCCATRLSDYWIFVSDSPFNTTDTPANLQVRSGTWSSHQTTTPNPFATMSTGGVQGRFVRIQLSGTNNLSLAEVYIN